MREWLWMRYTMSDYLIFVVKPFWINKLNSSLPPRISRLTNIASIDNKDVQFRHYATYISGFFLKQMINSVQQM